MHHLVFLVFHSYSSLHLLNCWYLWRVKLTTVVAVGVNPSTSSVKRRPFCGLTLSWIYWRKRNHGPLVAVAMRRTAVSGTLPPKFPASTISHIWNVTDVTHCWHRIFFSVPGQKQHPTIKAECCGFTLMLPAAHASHQHLKCLLKRVPTQFCGKPEKL